MKIRLSQMYKTFAQAAVEEGWNDHLSTATSQVAGYQFHTTIWSHPDTPDVLVVTHNPDGFACAYWGTRIFQEDSIASPTLRDMFEAIGAE